jgi:subtilase family serine protease
VSVTAVGGVTVPLSNAGTYLGPITGWGQQTGGGTGGASGGGTSCYIPLPSWQVEPSYISSEGGSLSATNNGCAGNSNEPLPYAGGGGRLVPDISLEGDPATGVSVIANVAFGGEQFDIGGTSVATPEMAAMWALVLQACAQTSSCATASGSKPYRLGNAAPLLWSKVYGSQTLYTSSIYDVTFGNNGITPCAFQGGCPNPTPTSAAGYTAGTGWDAVTGLGAPFARHLITAITGT